MEEIETDLRGKLAEIRGALAGFTAEATTSKPEAGGLHSWLREADEALANADWQLQQMEAAARVLSSKPDAME
jgi:hypothetical protein